MAYLSGTGQWGQCFCCRALITLVTPLHQPDSANAAASVCLYRKQERPLRCRPIDRPRPTVGLWISCTLGPVGDRFPPPPVAFPAHVLTAVETRPLAAVLHAHPSATSTDCPAASDGGGRQFTSLPSGGWLAIVLPWSCSPCSPLPWPFCDVLGAPPPAMSIDQWGPRISHEQYRGPAGYRPSPPSCPHQRSNSDHVGKRYILGRNQESREIRELRLNPGNAISRELTSLVMGSTLVS